ncbi:hypothetical protein DL93DRAFT_351061 [Clavulina sp. PMI_390]|nr:hypothetical protein DL93DRAFT_351061 [Clavulina sp. PMI_390]
MTQAPFPLMKTGGEATTEQIGHLDSFYEVFAACNLPLEIMGYIAGYADLSSLKNLSLASRSLKNEAARYLWQTVLFESSHPERFFIMQRYVKIIRNVQLRFNCEAKQYGKEDFPRCERMLSILFTLPRLQSLHLLVHVPFHDHKEECRIFQYFLGVDFLRCRSVRRLTLTGELYHAHQQDLIAKLLFQLPNLSVLDLTRVHRAHIGQFKPGMLPRLVRLYTAAKEDLSAAVGSPLEHLSFSCGRVDMENLEILISLMTTSLASLRSIQISASGTLETLNHIFKCVSSLPGLLQLHIEYYLLHAFLPLRHVASILSAIERTKSNGGLGQLSELAFISPPFEREAGKHFIPGCFGILDETLHLMEIRQMRENDRASEKVIRVFRDSAGDIIFPTSV